LEKVEKGWKEGSVLSVAEIKSIPFLGIFGRGTPSGAYVNQRLTPY